MVDIFCGEEPFAPGAERIDFKDFLLDAVAPFLVCLDRCRLAQFRDYFLVQTSMVPLGTESQNFVQLIRKVSNGQRRHESILTAIRHQINSHYPMSYGIQLHISGEYACFTRPEMKVERVSYDVITPSAARGILEAIYWKPQIRWVIDRIHVLKPIRFTNIRRNEVGAKAGAPTAAAMRGETVPALCLVIEEQRQQRAATLLRDVAYVLEARFEILDYRFEKGGPDLPARDCEGKHLDMFTRRARSGQCFHQPCLGNREFPARFTLIEEGDPLPPCELPPEQLNKELGWMLHDIAYLPADKKARDSFLTGQGKRVRAEPRFFKASIEDGIITVPPLDAAHS